MDMKKRFLAICVALASVLLSACSGAGEAEEKGAKYAQFVFPRRAVYGDYYITYGPGRELTYFDLENGTSSPACVVAGCKHEWSSAECTASGAIGITFPFAYDNSLYYFAEDTGNFVTEFYKCSLNGGSREQVFSFEPERVSETELYSPVIQNCALYDEKLYVAVYNMPYKTDIETGVGGTDGEALAGFRIFTFDLKTNELSLFYETEKLYSSSFDMFGAADGELYCFITGQSAEYDFESYEEKLEAIQDGNSDYNKTLVRKFFSLNLADKHLTELCEAVYNVGSGGAFYSADDGIYSPANGKILDVKADFFYPSSEGLIYAADGRRFLYSDGKIVDIGEYDGYRINWESENYFMLWSPDSEQFYCKKTDYLNGTPNYIRLTLEM